MKISLRKIRHLYLIYGVLNILLIVIIILSSYYLYKKQITLYQFESTISSELMNLSAYKSMSYDFVLSPEFDDDFYIKGVDDKSLEFLNQINNSKLQISYIEKNSKINDLHYIENIQGLLSDLEILKSENTLLFDYIRKIGNNEHGAILKLNNAVSDLELKLNTLPKSQLIKEEIDQSMFLILLFTRNREEIVFREIETRLSKIKSQLSLSDSISNNYMSIRISDSFQNFESNFRELARTVLEIGLSKKSGLLLIIDDRYSKTKLRLEESLRLLQLEKNTIEIRALLVLIVMFLFVVALNFASALYFIQHSRNFTTAVNIHFNALNKGEFVKIDRKKVTDEVLDLIAGLESFSNKFINSGKCLNSLSSESLSQELDKNNILELFYPAILKIKQKFEEYKTLIKEERKKQFEIQWIKEGIDKLTEVMRQEFDNPLLHSNKIIYTLIQYLNIPMGAIYHLRDEDGIKYIEMVASFAYGKEKQLYKKIEIGEGIVGSAASEKKTLNLTNVPDGYFNIVSGFSESKPKNILVSPIKLNDEIYGVIELASLSRFKDEEIQFVEEVCKAVAYSFAISKVYMDTLFLFESANLEIAQLKSENESLLSDNEESKINYKQLKERGIDNEYILDKLNEFAIMINLDLDGNILEVNSRFEQFFNADKKKFVHSNYREYMMDFIDDFDFENIWRILRAGMQHELDQKVIIGNQEYWLNQHYFPMKDQKGRVKGIKIMAFDITDKMRLESQLIDLKSTPD